MSAEELELAKQYSGDYEADLGDVVLYALRELTSNGNEFSLGQAKGKQRVFCFVNGDNLGEGQSPELALFRAYIKLYKSK